MDEPTLPYELTKGVTATREGLIVDKQHALYPWVKLHGSVKVWPLDYNAQPYRVWKWPQAAKHLRYREGEPWCHVDGIAQTIECHTGRALYLHAALHRLAALLCDDAEAFRTLRWAIHNLGEEQVNDT